MSSTHISVQFRPVNAPSGLRAFAEVLLVPGDRDGLAQLGHLKQPR